MDHTQLPLTLCEHATVPGSIVSCNINLTDSTLWASLPASSLKTTTHKTQPTENPPLTTGPRYVTADVQLKPLHSVHTRHDSRNVLVEATFAIIQSCLWPHAGVFSQAPHRSGTVWRWPFLCETIPSDPNCGWWLL